VHGCVQVRYLEKADLSGNLIVYIEEGAFASLRFIKALDLSGNRSYIKQ
jgi:hypothetical protein